MLLGRYPSRNWFFCRDPGPAFETKITLLCQSLWFEYAYLFVLVFEITCFKVNYTSPQLLSLQVFITQIIFPKAMDRHVLSFAKRGKMLLFCHVSWLIKVLKAAPSARFITQLHHAYIKTSILVRSM